jgi:membrane associated rhomboid family serine protease
MTTDGAGDRAGDDIGRFGTVAFYAALGRAFVVMCAVIPVLAMIELLDQATGGRLDVLFGIRPRAISGIDGIILAPLVHADFNHLVSNAAPLVLLGTFVLAAGVRRFLLATLLIAIVSGLGVWFTTPANYLVVGASGVIFGWLGFLLVRGIVEHSLWNLGVTLVVGLLYGWQVFALLPTERRISWQGHLFGFLGGAVAAILLRQRSARAYDAGPVDEPAPAAPEPES